MKPAFAIPLALVFVLLIVLPVSAAPPVVDSGTVTDDYPIFDATWPCPGIEIWDNEVYTYRVTTYFDNQGNAVRYGVHAEGFDNLYNKANPANRLSGHFIHNVEINASTGEEFDTGIPIHITAPGYGTVLVLAGRWSQFPFEHLAGKDSLSTDSQDLTQFCSLLAVK